MRAILIGYFLSFTASASFYFGVEAPRELEKKDIPEVYRSLYSFWRNQYEVSRFLLDKSALAKRPVIELPLIFSFEGSDHSFFPSEEKDPYFGTIYGPPKLNHSSLNWLGSLIIADSYKNFSQPSEVFVHVVKVLSGQAKLKKSIREDLQIFEEGLDANDMKYIQSMLDWNESEAKNKFRKIEVELNSLQVSRRTFDSNYRALHYEWPSLGYDPTLKARVDYAERLIDANVYYSYAALYADLDYLKSLRTARDEEYIKRYRTSQELYTLMSEYDSKIAKLRVALEGAKSEVALAKNQNKNRDLIIADHKAKLAAYYSAWGHTSDPFRRSADHKKEFEDRLRIDEDFSYELEARDSPYNYWKRRDLALIALKESAVSFQKLCKILDVSSFVKCVQMPEYLLEHEDEFLKRIARAQYSSLSKALADLHWIHFEAVEKLNTHFTDPDAFYTKLLNLK